MGCAFLFASGKTLASCSSWLNVASTGYCHLRDGRIFLPPFKGKRLSAKASNCYISLAHILSPVGYVSGHVWHAFEREPKFVLLRPPLCWFDGASGNATVPGPGFYALSSRLAMDLSPCGPLPEEIKGKEGVQPHKRSTFPLIPVSATGRSCY